MNPVLINFYLWIVVSFFVFNSECIKCPCNTFTMNNYLMQRQTCHFNGNFKGKPWFASCPMILHLQSSLSYASSHSFIHSFIPGMHHYECIAPNIDINLQSGRFWAMSIASFTERFIDFRSCWVSSSTQHVMVASRWSPLVLLTGSPKLCIFFNTIPLCLPASLLSSSYSLSLTYIS